MRALKFGGRWQADWKGAAAAGEAHRGVMANLNTDQRRALRILARHLDGCAEAVLLAEGFSIGQLAELALEGLVETKRAPVGSGRHSVWIKITEEGRKAIAE
jgi:DNA-binding MarR family transcriptional regulator